MPFRNSMKVDVSIDVNKWPSALTPTAQAYNITISKLLDRVGDTKAYIRLIGKQEDLLAFYRQFYGTRFADKLSATKMAEMIAEFENSIQPFESLISEPTSLVVLDFDGITIDASKVYVSIRSAGTMVERLEATSALDALGAFSTWCTVHEPMHSLLTITAKCTNLNFTVIYWKFDGTVTNAADNED